LFGALRDWLVEREGRDAADQIISDFQIQWLREDDFWDQSDPESFANPEKETPTDMPPDKTPVGSGGGTPARANQPSTDLAAREAALEQRERALARQEHERFLDKLIQDGKVLPAAKAETLNFMDTLSNREDDCVSFGEAKDKRTPLAQFQRLLQQLPQQVPLGEAAPESGADRERDVSFAAPADAEVDADRLKIHQQALEYQRQNPNADYVTAVRAVGGAHV
jgi:hypothetical protein